MLWIYWEYLAQTSAELPGEPQVNCTTQNCHVDDKFDDTKFIQRKVMQKSINSLWLSTSVYLYFVTMY